MSGANASPTGRSQYDMNADDVEIARLSAVIDCRYSPRLPGYPRNPRLIIREALVFLGKSYSEAGAFAFAALDLDSAIVRNQNLLH